MAKIVCVVPTIRPESMVSFREAWGGLFEKHNVTLITVWDGENPRVDVSHGDKLPISVTYHKDIDAPDKDLFCRFTDGCRNLGFVVAATLQPDYILTLDDDVAPVKEWKNETTKGGYGGILSYPSTNDPIQQHLDVLSLKVPISWMPTFIEPVEGAFSTKTLYPRGFPYNIRDEAPVMLSHGSWTGVLDWDGETQRRLEESGGDLGRGFYSVGPIPKGVLFPLCGMNVMIRREALPYFYFAPMGPDTGIEKECECVDPTGMTIRQNHCPICSGKRRVSALNRFADIWMGIHLKREFDKLGWACYTGGSVVHHTRASDARKNVEQEKLVREWNEVMWRSWNGIPEVTGPQMLRYINSYAEKRQRYASLINDILNKR